MFRDTRCVFCAVVVCLMLFSIGNTLYEGDTCTNNNPNGERLGRCLSAYKCSWALQQIRTRQSVSTCNFVGKTPIVCCPLKQIKEEGNRAPNSTTKSSRVSTNNSIIARESLKQLNEISRFGIISRAKCREYYPRVIKGIQFAVGGVNSLAEEFPHMAALGYGKVDDKQWKCGGSLISLQHVLTAAHCLYSRDLGKVKYIRLGDLDIATNTDPAEPQDFNVKRTITHPNYNSSTLKNDIAIIKLDRPVRQTKYVKPACLYASHKIDKKFELTASGWGITEFAGNPSNHLLKVFLRIINKDDCQKQYLKAGPRGQIDGASQVCAESANNGKIMDTCQGDSGGPLQLANYTNQRHYYIIGITSFGKACGITNSAGIYTRVSFYIPWIESVVFSS